MKELACYLQMRFLNVCVKSVPILMLAILFLLSIRLVKVDQVMDVKTVFFFFVMSLIEVLPWLLAILFYIYLLWMNKHGELQLMSSYTTPWWCWYGLKPIWICFALIMMVYMGFVSPPIKQHLRSQNVLNGLRLNQAVSIYDGIMWLGKNGEHTTMDWWYQSGKQQAKLRVKSVEEVNDALNLQAGEIQVKSAKRGLTVMFEQGKMVTGETLSGVKYQSIKTCFANGAWGEIGFRLNHILLVFTATALMFYLYLAFGVKSLVYFVSFMLLIYLPLWSHVKGNRDEVPLLGALLPSYVIIGSCMFLHYRMRNQLR